VEHRSIIGQNIEQQPRPPAAAIPALNSQACADLPLTQVVAGAYKRDAVVDNIVSLVEKARSEGVPVVWVQHSSDALPEGSEAWRYVPELVARESEPVVHKLYGDSFDDTELEAVLAEHKVGHLVVAGAQTDACIRSTLLGGIVRGYDDTTLIEDAHTTEDLTRWGAPTPDKVIDHTNR
jgi:nicotinamidase-related amidase